MNIGSRLAWIVAAFIVMLAAAPAGAGAAQVVVDFESTAGTTLDENSAAAQGVRFGRWFYNRPVPARWGIKAFDGNRKAFDQIIRGGGEHACNHDAAHPNAVLWAKLDYLATHVQVHLGTFTQGLIIGQAHLIGYDGNGVKKYDSATGTVTHDSSGTTLSIGSPFSIANPDIRYFEVTLPAEQPAYCPSLMLDDIVIKKPDVEEPGIATSYVGPTPNPNPALTPGVVGLRPEVTEVGTVDVDTFGNVSPSGMTVISKPLGIDVTLGAPAGDGSRSIAITAQKTVENARSEIVVRSTASIGHTTVTSDLTIPVRTARDWTLAAPAEVDVTATCLTHVPIALESPNSFTHPGPGDDGRIDVHAPNRPTVTATATGGAQITPAEGGFDLLTPAVGDTTTVSVTAQDGSATPQTVDISVKPTKKLVLFAPSDPVTTPPQFLAAGRPQEFRIDGACAASVHDLRIRFGNRSRTNVNPTVEKIGDRAYKLTAIAPRDADRTPAQLWLGDQHLGTFPYVPSLNDYRFRDTLHMPNQIPDAYDAEDLERFFGFAQTHIEWPAFNCTPAPGRPPDDCLLGVADPIAQIGIDIMNDFVATEEGGGTCFGMSAVQEVLYFRRPNAAAFPHLPEVNPVNIGHILDTSVLRGETKLYQQGILAKSSIDRVFNHLTAATAPTAAALRADLEASLGKGIPRLMSIRAGGSAHVITAYDIEDRGFGAYSILVHDVNIPWEPSIVDGTKDSLQGQVDAARILVEPNSTWSYGPLGIGGKIRDLGKPTDPTGTGSWLISFPSQALTPPEPLKAKYPEYGLQLGTLAQYAGMLAIKGWALGVQEFTGGGRTARAAAAAAAPQPIAFPVPDQKGGGRGIVLVPNKLSLPIGAGKPGTYELSFAGNGMAIAGTVTTKGNERPTLSVDSASGTIEIGGEKGGASVALDIARRGKKGSNIITSLSGAVPAGATETLRLDPGNGSARLTHDGKATKLTLETLHTTAKGAFYAKPGAASIGDGSVLRAELARGEIVTQVRKGRRVVRTLRSKPRKPKRPAIDSKRRRGTLTLTATAPGAKGTTSFVSQQVVRGRKLLSSRELFTRGGTKLDGWKPGRRARGAGLSYEVTSIVLGDTPAGRLLPAVQVATRSERIRG